MPTKADTDALETAGRLLGNVRAAESSLNLTRQLRADIISAQSLIAATHGRLMAELIAAKKAETAANKIYYPKD